MNSAYEISTSYLSAWRSAHFPRKIIELQSLRDFDTTLDFVLSHLKDPNIRSFLNDLDGGAKGDRFDKLYERLQKRSPTALRSGEIYRDIDYCSQLLLSSVIRNDTGKKGKINLVALQTLQQHTPQPADRLVIIPEPSSGDFGPLLELAEIFNTESTPERRQELEKELRRSASRLYEYRVSIRSPLHLTEPMICNILKTQQAVGVCIASEVRQKYGLRKLVIPYSVDYFLVQDRPQILEIHCPPRTIETSFLGFRSLLSGEIFPVEMAVKISLDYYVSAQGHGACNVVIYNPEPNAGAMVTEARSFVRTFQNFGNIEVRLAQTDSELHACRPDILYLCDECDSALIDSLDANTLVVPAPQMIQMISDRGEMRTRMESAGIPIPKGLLLPKGSTLNSEHLGHELGDWVVSKTRQHLPWWSPLKVRTAFVCLANERHLAKLRQMNTHTDMILEEMVTESVDSEGYFGELRVFSVLTASA